MPFIFLLFNLGDCLGRLTAGLSRSAPATWGLALYCTARCALVPAILSCNLVTPHQWLLPLVFRWAAQQALPLRASAGPTLALACAGRTPSRSCLSSCWGSATGTWAPCC